jgi:predicted DNA-binding protein (MmcQ/YjbR family)
MTMDHDKKIKSSGGIAVLDKVRSICSLLPEVEEKVDSFGHTSFRVNDKPFIMMGENEEGPSMAIKTAPATQEILLHQEGYVKTPYIGQHGWVSLRAVESSDWNEIEALITEAYGRTAPKRLTKAILQKQSR